MRIEQLKLRDENYYERMKQDIRLARIPIIVISFASVALGCSYYFAKESKLYDFIGAAVGSLLFCFIPFYVIWKTPNMKDFFKSRLQITHQNAISNIENGTPINPTHEGNAIQPYHVSERINNLHM